jgi:ParB-like chromosome segregation protein Spo0J
MPGGMDDEEFNVFCEDVESRGLIYPITIFEGKVLDGWHRYRACHRTGTALKTIEYKGDDPAGYIAACNIHRRRLSSLQRALFGARVHIRNGVPQREICKRYGISNTVLTMVLKALDSRNAAVIKRIESDSEYSRGMLREELAERGLVHENYGRSRKEEDFEEEDVTVVDNAEGTRTHVMPRRDTPNSVFALGATDSSDEHETEDLVGTKRTAPKAKKTAPQRMQEAFDELMPDEKATFLQMIWPKARPIAEDLHLPGLASAAPSKGKAKLKAA